MSLPRSLSTRARAGIAAAVVVTSLGVPAFAVPAEAASARTAASADCNNANAAVAKDKHQIHAAKIQLGRSQRALRNAKQHHQNRKANKARKAVAHYKHRVKALTATMQKDQKRANYACAAPKSATKATTVGSALGLLALGNGLPLSTASAGQLTSMLDAVVPGISSQLDPGQLTALLGGFNALGSGTANPTDLLNQLGSGFSAGDITSLLGGTASPTVLTSLGTQLVGTLTGLAGSAPSSGSFDPTTLLTTVAGFFGDLNPTQFGDLLVLLTRATGNANSTFSPTQLQNLVGGLAPGALSSFSPSDLTTMLTVLNGHSVSESTLATLLGGQFTVPELSSVMGGSAPTTLVGQVFSAVMAQFATGGHGSLPVPTTIDPTQLTSLASTVTSLVTGLLGGGGGLVGGICGIVPIPGLCPTA
jgi:hypothetical protein